MNKEMNSPEQYIAAIRTMKKSLDIKAEIKSGGIIAASAHWRRRYSTLCDSVQQFYGWEHGTCPKPDVLPSSAANAEEGPDKTNIYYMCKELRKGFPWEIERHYLMEPTAVMLKCLDVCNTLYPSTIIYEGTILAQRFTNLWTRRKSRDPNFERERDVRWGKYIAEVDEVERNFHLFHQKLSTFFAAIENENLDANTKRIRDTNVKTTKIANKLNVKNEFTSAIAQDRADRIWEEHRRDVEVAKLGKNKRKASYADVFTVCKRLILDQTGLTSATAFGKAVKASKKRKKGK